MNHYTHWLELKEDNPGKYARDIAGLMNISEAELTFARVGHDAWRLHGEIREILGALEAVGETRCICRTSRYRFLAIFSDTILAIAIGKPAVAIVNNGL